MVIGKELKNEVSCINSKGFLEGRSSVRTNVRFYGLGSCVKRVDRRTKSDRFIS